MGSSLCSKLVERGYTTVTAFDLHYPEEDETDSVHKVKVSLRVWLIMNIEGCVLQKPSSHCCQKINYRVIVLKVQT